MAARRRRSTRDHRRRSHGQNLLVDESVVDRLLCRLDLHADDLVVDVGAGRGALTIPLARAGARVLAIERDRDMVAQLQRRVEQARVPDRVQIRRADLRQVPWPRRPYRVVAAPPYALTTRLWWRFELGEVVARQAFRPVPAVDSAWLTATRRDPPVLPDHLASRFREVLEPHWRLRH